MYTKTAQTLAIFLLVFSTSSILQERTVTNFQHSFEFPLKKNRIRNELFRFEITEIQTGPDFRMHLTSVSLKALGIFGSMPFMEKGRGKGRGSCLDHPPPHPLSLRLSYSEEKQGSSSFYYLVM
jgi:hypothetical protein